MQPLFTPGAQRVRQLAAGIARHCASEQIDAEHLLWALALDESRAWEILAAHRISRERIREWLPLPLPDEVPPAAHDDAEALPVSETLDAVYVEARRQVALLGRHVEVGTEHLLLGLAAVDSPVKTLLGEHGLSPVSESLHGSDVGAAQHPLPEKVRLALAPPPVGENADLYRILDAAANRTREGLRVLEDYARFHADDRHLTEVLKSWRHHLAGALSRLDGRALVSCRDTRNDVGTTVHTAREASRESLADVVRASCKRVQEATRTLEEYGKLVSPEFAAAMGELRYSGYTIEKALVTTLESRDRLADFRLYLLVTQAQCPGGAGPMIRAALAEGVRVVQVREKSMPDRELVDWGKRVREWTAQAGALFIMNDRPDLAVLTDADGVHVGQDELSVHDARKIVGPHRLIGVSTHDLDQARGAVLDGADYIGIGPVFASKTKAFASQAGLEFVRQVSREITLPGFAIGGIDEHNVDQVVAAGARRVAVSSAIAASDDPARVTRALLQALHA